MLVPYQKRHVVPSYHPPKNGVAVPQVHLVHFVMLISPTKLENLLVLYVHFE